MLIYLDNCALNRLLDEPDNTRIIHEAAGVREIVRRIEAGEHKLVLSSVLLKEIDQTRDHTVREDLLAILPEHARFVSDTPLLYFAARLVMEAARLDWFDALHVASAAAGGAAVLFTTDDDILKAAKRNPNFAWTVRIANPADWNQVLR